ncbi:YcnI family copper-binding membrane protein [Aeromicrobium terrae]|uniref:YcnI family protein n=1 Tax=Aeromicrobium terrae TaxID=2498846 RepID=A0A5C8NPK2_9ACTN|nr:YcnI family protein [Aeromicrobium terrae]TXL63047.1 YcnI family protein [Aeromicrobium terrae]
MSRTPARLCAALFSSALVLVASAASAHVTVSSPDAAPGGFGKIVFRVPTESPDASTTKVRITLPKDTPFAFVNAQAKPGWTVDVKEEKLAKPTKVGDSTLTKAVRTVTWTATGDGIAPGEFDEFALSGGPFPDDVKTLRFDAEQTYSDGEIVAWDQVGRDGGEPEHPAPTLTLAVATDDQASDDAESGSDGTTRTLAIAALALAAVGLVLTLRQNRQRA